LNVRVRVERGVDFSYSGVAERIAAGLSGRVRRWKEAEKNMILKLVPAAKQFLLSKLIPQVEMIPPLVVRCSVGGIVVARGFVAMPC
jgi:hypothetical protein